MCGRFDEGMAIYIYIELSLVDGYLFPYVERIRIPKEMGRTQGSLQKKEIVIISQVLLTRTQHCKTSKKNVRTDDRKSDTRHAFSAAYFLRSMLDFSTCKTLGVPAASAPSA